MTMRLRHEKRPNYRKLQQPGLPVEEAPEVLTSTTLSIDSGPRSPDVFYRGEEAGAAPKSPGSSEMERLFRSCEHFTLAGLQTLTAFTNG